MEWNTHMGSASLVHAHMFRLWSKLWITIKSNQSMRFRSPKMNSARYIMASHLIAFLKLADNNSEDIVF